MKLTAKQQRFAELVALEGMTQADAYRTAYAAENMKAETIRKRASELMSNGDVTGMVESLKAKKAEKVVEKAALTADDIVQELEEARLAAMTGDRPQASAAVAASKAKAEVLGLVVQKVEHSGVIGIMELADSLTEEQKERVAMAILQRRGYDIEVDD